MFRDKSMDNGDPIRVRRREAAIFAVLLSFFATSNAEQITMTTWYPAPVGVYQSLVTTGGPPSSPVNTILNRDAGKVGVGTANPAAKLDVSGNGSSYTTGIAINNPSGGATYLYQGAASPDSGILSFGNNSGWKFHFARTSDGAKFMTLQDNGNVGVGTTVPDTVNGATGVSGRHLNLKNTTDRAFLNVEGTYADISLVASSAAADQKWMIIRNAGGTTSFIPHTDATHAIVKALSIQHSNGNVGIGTTSPGAKFQVGASGDGSVALANAWNTFSSRRYKENIRPIGGALDKINRLRGVEFEWKGSGKRDLGVVAEEVGRVFPEIVEYEPNGRDARGLDYSKLVGPLIEAVKAQQEEIEEQRQRIKTQSNRIETQQARIEALEKSLAGMRSK